MNIRILFIGALSLGLLACGNMARHPDSGYSSIDSRRQMERRPSSVRGVVDSRRNLVNKDLQFLKKLERRLEDGREKEQYYSYQTHFRSIKDRIRFLQKPSMRERAKYMERRVFARKKRPYKRSTLKLIEKRDIALGMTENDIKQSWGEPHEVSYAGDPMYGNARWSYTRTLKTANGYVEQTRQVFFESGRVSGWKTL